MLAPCALGTATPGVAIGRGSRHAGSIVFHRGAILSLTVITLSLSSARLVGAACPTTGGSVVTRLDLPAESAGVAAELSGTLVVPSCELDDSLARDYTAGISCTTASACALSHTGLAPGIWVHRIEVTSGEAQGQIQTRRSLIMAASAGDQVQTWQLFRQVLTVETTDDGADCRGCLRQALRDAATATKPALIVFAPSVLGTIVLDDALPELSSDRITIDALDSDGLPHQRTIDANGLSRAALRITGADNHVLGLRLTNVGGNSDLLLIDGPRANRNRIESVQVVGRGLDICERLDETGCVVARQCIVPNRIVPRGDCGDDGIAIRDSAGATGANILSDVDVSGAFDKGIKISEGGVAVVEDSWIHGNADGGIQATLEGNLTARRNRSEGNRGTAGANGIAVNGARIGGVTPSLLVTRGNIVRNNALRGISVRSLSRAVIRDDFVCGNGSVGNDVGFGIALLDAAGLSAFADVSGAALVKNVDGGVLAMGNSIGIFGGDSPGRNAFALNGEATGLSNPTNFRNLSTQTMAAVGNHWQGCGRTYRCDAAAVLREDVYSPTAAVLTMPALPNAIRRAPTITEIYPKRATRGDLVWIHGSDFDAVGAAAEDTGCNGPGRPCSPADANCVIIDRQPAEIVAATPTTLVIRAPFTCVEPVKLIARTRRSRGYARATFCTTE